jgi:dTDP-glucose 4,6-dehydratase
MILVTGGAGFIGSNFVLEWIAAGGSPGNAVVNLDLLTYAGNRANLKSLEANPDGNPRHIFVQGDICNAPLVRALLRQHRPRAIVHFAAESHVDRSIAAPGAFARTNVQGTLTLLEEARSYLQELDAAGRRDFRFLHVSTDEVYGSLAAEEAPFTEAAAYKPSSPYAASKAGADHLVRAWFHTYGLPTLITNCSNNYGPFQFPEKLISLSIANAIEGRPLPVYGDGRQVRDWLFVLDHCAAIRAVLERGAPGETYNIGGESERKNIDVVRAICALVDELAPDAALGKREKLIAFVPDRPGHDRRYAMNIAKISQEIGWKPAVSFEDGLRRTVEWYLGNREWLANVRERA